MYYIIHLARPRPFHFSGFPSRTRRRAEKAVCGEASDVFQPFVRANLIMVLNPFFVTNLFMYFNPTILDSPISADFVQVRWGQ